MNRAEQAERFRAMHVPGDPVVLPNAWDAASARIVEAAGYPAVATTSAGIAFLEGYRDGGAIGREAMLAGVARIARVVDVPVTADMESGYGTSIEDAAETARATLAAGAIGLNFEDATGVRGMLADAEAHAARVSAMRRVADDAGVRLVINARTDVYLEEAGEADGRFAEAVRRAALYRAAGADCIFVPGVTDEATIGALVRAIDAPVNILAGAASPPLARLRELGVARVSLGSAPVRHALSALRDLVADVRERGRFDRLEGTMTHAETNALFA